MITITEFFGNEPSFQYRNIALIHKKSIRDGFLASLNSFIFQIIKYSIITEFHIMEQKKLLNIKFVMQT